jgi:hypothetical protein
MDDDEKRAGAGRRTLRDRRSGQDTRAEREKQRLGERRSADRRSGQDRRTEPGAPDSPDLVQKR